MLRIETEHIAAASDGRELAVLNAPEMSFRFWLRTARIGNHLFELLVAPQLLQSLDIGRCRPRDHEILFLERRDESLLIAAGCFLGIEDRLLDPRHWSALFPLGLHALA